MQILCMAASNASVEETHSCEDGAQAEPSLTQPCMHPCSPLAQEVLLCAPLQDFFLEMSLRLNLTLESVAALTDTSSRNSVTFEHSTFACASKAPDGV